MLAATGVLLAATLTSWRVTRLEGILMVGAHGSCVAYLASGAV
jgi:Ca2+/Na+ antiporter